MKIPNIQQVVWKYYPLQRKGLSLQFPTSPALVYTLAKKRLKLWLLTEVSRYFHF